MNTADCPKRYLIIPKDNPKEPRKSVSNERYNEHVQSWSKKKFVGDGVGGTTSSSSTGRIDGSRRLSRGLAKEQNLRWVVVLPRDCGRERPGAPEGKAREEKSEEALGIGEDKGE